MRVKAEKRATEEQIENLIENYNTNEKAFDILYTGKIHTIMMLEYALEKGITIIRMVNTGTMPVSLPECRKDNYFSNDMYSEKIHFSIVEPITKNV
jgi:hypothetical protein